MQNYNASSHFAKEQASQFFGSTQQAADAVRYRNYDVTVVRMLLQETGTYQDQFVRPYMANIQNQGTINNIMTVIEQSNYRPTEGAFNALASDILQIKQQVGARDAVQVPNGWGERRMRFMLEVCETSVGLGNEVYHTFVQGFTSHFGISLAGNHCDPNMQFFPNSFIRMHKYVTMTPNGPQEVYRVVNSGQIVNGVLTLLNDMNVPVEYFRPTDILAGVQRKQDRELFSSDVTDGRTKNIGGLNTAFSNFHNNTPSNYLSRLLTPLAQSSQTVGYGPGHTTFVDTAVTNAMSKEPTPHDSPFMDFMMRELGPQATACFTARELEVVAPNLQRAVFYKPVAHQFSGALADRSNSGTWNNALPETIIAAKVMNTLPGLMWDHFIGVVSFTLSNKLGYNQPVQYSNLFSIVPNLPASRIQHFVSILQEQLFLDISMNNNICFEVNVNASSIGDVMIGVAVNGGSAIWFTAPAFGSGILNPMYTRDSQSYTDMVSGVSNLAQCLDQITRNQTVGSSMGLTGGI